MVNEKKERNSRRKAELKQERSTLEKQVQGRDEELKAMKMQLEVGCLHHAMCISSVVMQSGSVCVRAVGVFAVSIEHELQRFCSSQYVLAEWSSLHSKLRILTVAVTHLHSLHSGQMYQVGRSSRP